MGLSLSALARTPSRLYQRLSESPVGRRMARDSIWSVAGSVTSRLLILAGMVVVARMLGKVSFGEIALVQATLGVFGLMAGVGLGGTATRFVAQYVHTDAVRAGRIIALVTSTSVATIMFGVVVLVASSRMLSGAILHAPHLESALKVGAVLMASTALRGVQAGVYSGLAKFDTVAKLNAVEGVASMILIVLLGYYFDVDGVLLGLALGALATWVLGHFLLRSELASQGIEVRYAGCWKDWRILTNYSMPTLLASTVATPVLWGAMVLVARSDHGLAGLGVYNAAYQWHGPMMFIPMVLMSVSLPILVRQWESADRRAFRSLVFWNCASMLLASVPPAAIVAAVSPWIMGFYGPGFDEGWLVLVVLMAAAPLHGIARMTGGALLAMDRAWWFLLGNVVWGGAMITLALLLVPDWGSLGLALSFLAAQLVVAVIFVMAVLSRSGVNMSGAGST